MSPAIVMSPITFKQQVKQLVSEVTRCIQLCEDIRAHRKIGSSHENLDRLESTLESAEGSIAMAYNTTRRLVGSQFEIGDVRARSEMDGYIVDVQTKIKPRLQTIAQPATRRHRNENIHPGFRELLNQWKAIYQEVTLTMLSLSRRIEAGEYHSTQPTARPTTPPSWPRKAEEITISFKEFDHLLQHMKNSWEEIIVDGRYRYVNIHDPTITRSELPEFAYVKTIPRPTRRLSRSPSYERCSPRSRASCYE